MGRFRVMVEVPPVQNLGRSEDEMVAKVELDLRRLFPDASTDHTIDLHSVQVIRQDTHGSPYPKHVQQRSPGDRPFRFYDHELLDEFPTWRRYASLEAIGNRPVLKMTERLPFGHRVFNAVAEHLHGTLVWAHTQIENEASTYGIYFDLLSKTRDITSPPAGWIGDGSNRIIPDSKTISPPGNSSTSVVDWNGDGVRDLLIGAEKGCILYFSNRGSHADPAFDFQGFVRADGEMLLTPNWPIAELPKGKPGEVFPADYLAIPCVCDWDGDGFLDLINRFYVSLNDGNGLPHSFSRRVNLLAGQPSIRHPNPHGDENSFVTLHDMDGDGDHDCIYGAHSGHIWYHENSGNDEAPVMDIKGYRLPLADGGLIRVGEPPAEKKPGFNFTDLQGARPKPTLADFNQDGRVDLVIGDTYGRVRYFQNEGHDDEGRHRFAQPVMILESKSRLSVQAADWTGDDVDDLFVITGSQISLLANRATPDHCQFEAPTPLQLPRTIGGYYGVSPVDLNGDGDTDLVYHSSARITCYVERSLLEYGYRPASITIAERKSE